VKTAYTKHALEKLIRPDVKKFKITKTLVQKIVLKPRSTSITYTGSYAALGTLTASHDLRVIYDIIEGNIKVITFHVARKGRYL